MPYVLALDQGTTSSRAIVFDVHGDIAAVAQKEFPQIFPRPGWVEHDPEDIWSSQISVAIEALSKRGLAARDIAAIGITNQRETTVVWDRRTGKPIHNAIVWQDRRTSGICDSLVAAGHEPLFRDKTGLVIDSYFAGTKVKWLLDTVDGAREAAEAGHLACGTIDSWLIWRLTGGKRHVTDVTNACRTLMFNIYTLDWDEDLLALLDVPRAMLPEVLPSSGLFGQTSEDLFSRSIPIAGVAGDQQAALFGQVCTRPGMVKNTYGTGCFLLMTTGGEAVAPQNRLLTTIAWQIEGHTEYALEGSIFVAGAAVRWLRDAMGLIKSAAETEALAKQADTSQRIFLVPAFTGLGSPHWDPHARGTIVGLTRGTGRPEIARAAIEAMVYQTRDVVEAMTTATGTRLRSLRVDGGASAMDSMLQLQADHLGVPVHRPKLQEVTALGAAYLAGLAADVWPSTTEISKQWQLDLSVEPNPSRATVDAAYADWKRAVERSRSWTNS